MSRRRDRLSKSGLRTVAGVVLALAFVSPLTPAQSQTQGDSDEVIERYLEDRNLTVLLAEQLTDRLSRTSGKKRGEIVERLAEALTRLIGSATDTVSLAAWEDQARELLGEASQSESLSLRMNLERARYVQAEQSAERFRVRLADQGESESASAVFKRIAPIFEQIALQSHQEILSLQRQEESARQDNTELLAGALRTSRRLRSLGMYLAGWANTYLAELHDNPQRAKKAMVQFGWLLGAPTNKRPEVGRVSEQLFRYEHVGRAAIGVAVCHAVLGDLEQAAAWLDLVERNNDTPAVVREQIAPRRATILARLGKWKRLDRALSRLRRDNANAETSDRSDDKIGSLLSPSLARLIVVLALEADDPSSKKLRDDMAREALADLVLHQDIAQVVDLASRYGTATLGADGFIAGHVRGLLAYKEAREKSQAIAGDDDAPATDQMVIASYRRAAKTLRMAMSTSDAEAFGEARAATAMLLGRCLYYASGDDGEGLEEAIDAFVQSADWSSVRIRAADAMWMAHRAARRLDQLRNTKRSGAIATLFNDRFPSDPRASVLRVELAAGGSLAPEDAIAILLDTPRESPAWEIARRHAARLLYEMYRSTSTDNRDWSALRYADVAEPLLGIDRARAVNGDAASISLALVRARRLLDAILSVDAPDAGRAQAVLETLQSMIALSGATAPPPAVEVLFRALQIALVRKAEIEAVRIIEALRADTSSSEVDRQRYVRFADQAFFSFVANRWGFAVDAGGDPSQRVDLARAVVSRGAQLLKDYGSESEESANSELLSVHYKVAHASFDLWQATSNSNALELSYREHKLVLAAQPSDRGALRRLADLAQAIGDNDTAMNCWRSLSAGLPSNTGPWFEARIRLIEMLTVVDPKRARQVLEQHIALRPDLGPEPWATRLRDLATSLGVDLPQKDEPEVAR